MAVFQNKIYGLQNFIASLAAKSTYFNTGKHSEKNLQSNILSTLDFSQDILSEKEVMQDCIDYVVRILSEKYSVEFKNCVSNQRITDKLAKLWYKNMIQFFRKRIQAIVEYCENMDAAKKSHILIEYASRHYTIMHKIGKKYSPTRIHNECTVTKRRRGHMGKLGITNKQLRENVTLIHGMTKSSW